MAEPILKLDRYVLLEEIGTGGMATVYKAKNTGPMGFEKLAAVKLLHPDFGAGSDVVRMFIDEARIGARLSHPNVIGVTDFGQIENHYFMAMEFVEGCNLSTLIKPGAARAARPLPLSAAACVMCDVLQGLEYVHAVKDEKGRSLGIVHRDISPQNIMIDRSGRAKIGDFGIATGQFRESFTNAGIVKGKVSYMSPEQAAGKPLDGRSDIAAAGLTLFAALSGQSAFGTGDTIAVLARAEEGLKPESVKALECPDEIREIILKATCARIQDRFQTAREFREALAAAVPDFDGHGRELLAGMVTRASKAPSGRKKAKEQTARVPGPEPRPTASSMLSRSMPSVPVSGLTIQTYRVLTGAVLLASIVALLLAMPWSA